MKTLKDYIIAEAAGKDALYVTVAASDEDAAAKLIDKHGFEIVDTNDDDDENIIMQIKGDEIKAEKALSAAFKKSGIEATLQIYMA